MNMEDVRTALFGIFFLAGWLTFIGLWIYAGAVYGGPFGVAAVVGFFVYATVKGRDRIRH